MKKQIVLLFLFSMMSFLLKAQVFEPETVHSEEEPSRWRVGGDIGIGGGNDSFSVNILPQIGYAIRENIESGISLGYTHYSFDKSAYNLLSAGMYLNYTVLPELILRGHFETMHGNYKNDKKTSYFREEALWLGVGYQTIGRVRFVTGLMFNVLYNKDKSVYSSPLRPFGGISISF